MADGARGNGARPTPGELLMRRIGRVEAELEVIWRRQAAADTMGERLAVIEREMAFAWERFDRLDQDIRVAREENHEVRQRLVSILLMITSGAAATVGAIVLNALGLV